MIEIPILTKPESLRNSFSRFDTFSRCELCYALDAILPRTPSTPAQARGSHVHDLYEFLARRRLQGRIWADETLWEEVLEVEGPLSENARRVYVDKIRPWLSEQRIVSAEEWIRGIRWGEERLAQTFAGKIDLVTETEDGEQTVWDYKTIGNSRKIKAKWEANRSLQLRIYCLATGARRAGFIYLQKTKPPVVVCVEFTDEELAATFTWLRTQEDVIEQRWREGGWALSSPESALCSAKWCPHWELCLGADDPSAIKNRLAQLDEENTCAK